MMYIVVTYVYNTISSYIITEIPDKRGRKATKAVLYPGTKRSFLK